MRERTNATEAIALNAGISGSTGMLAPVSPAARSDHRAVICLGLTLGLLLALGLWILWISRFETSLAQARRLMDGDRFAEARAYLMGVPLRWSRDPEVRYRLGVCEHACGQISAAVEAWSAVDQHTSWGVRAGLARARTLVGDLGRFSAAEDILTGLIRVNGPQRDEIRHTLSELYFWEGRRDRIRLLLEESWPSAADPVVELHDHWRVDTSPVLLEQIRWEVDRALRLAPDDDRVWLAQANLATQSGRFAEARGWLDRCVERRPADTAVWRARLDWSRAAGNLDEVRRSLTHLNANIFRPEERLSLRAWLASRLGDVKAERLALEDLLVIDQDSQALERLALLARDAGATAEARDYRRRKAEIDVAKDRYRQRIEESLTPNDFVEMAKLADTLGAAFRGARMVDTAGATCTRRPIGRGSTGTAPHVLPAGADCRRYQSGGDTGGYRSDTRGRVWCSSARRSESRRDSAAIPRRRGRGRS